MMNGRMDVCRAFDLSFDVILLKSVVLEEADYVSSPIWLYLGTAVH